MRTDQTITHWDKAKIESKNLNENYDALEKKLNANKMLRKHISKVCFNHHYFAEAKKLDEMDNNVEIEWVHIILSYINNLVEGAINLIEYGHSDHNFETECIKFTAYVFLAEYHDTTEIVATHKEFGKPFWIMKFLQKVSKIKRAKHRVEALLTSVCNLLKILCKSRTNRQTILFMQIFQSFSQNNEIPDVGSFIEVFSKDFEALFKVLSFTIQKPNSEMKNVLENIRELRIKEKEEDLRQQELSEISEEEEENKEEEKEENKEQEGVKRIEDPEKEVEDVDKFASVVYNKNILMTLHKDVIPLNLHLLTVVFNQTKDKRIQNKAIDILIDGFSQREKLLSEIIKVELIITEQDSNAYNQYKENYNRVKKLFHHLILDDLEYLLMQNFDKEKYRNRVRDTTIIMKNIKASLKRVFNDKTKTERMAEIKKNQNILRQFGMHTLLIKSMKEIYHRSNNHFDLFSAILKFLEYFCWNNKANQEALLPHIGFFLSLSQWDLDSPALISEIMKSYRQTDLGQKFMKFIVEKVTQRSLLNSHLLNFLALMASQKEQGNYTKLYILNRLIKNSSMRELMMDQEKADKKIETLEVYQKKRKTLKEGIVVTEKETLDAHLSLINLYSK